MAAVVVRSPGAVRHSSWKFSRGKRVFGGAPSGVVLSPCVRLPPPHFILREVGLGIREQNGSEGPGPSN